MKKSKKLSVFGGLTFVAMAGVLGACGQPANAQLGTTSSHVASMTTVSGRDTSFHITSSNQQVAAPALTSIRMFNQVQGWALDQRAILKTIDGGAHWNNITPAGITLSPISKGEFLSAQQAWIINPQANNVVVLRTSNGGQSWQSSTINEASAEPLTPTFINNTTGWLELSPGGPGAGSEPIDLYQTTNGGQNWTKISSSNAIHGLPAGGIKSGISFKDALNGWATGEQPSNIPWLYATHDGGKTWQLQKLQGLPATNDPGAEYQLTPPVLFGNHGLLPLQVTTSTYSGLLLYATHDSGKTWVANSQSIAPFTTANLYLVDLQHGWATDNRTGDLYQTHDGGQSWQDISKNFGPVSAFSFANVSDGWAIDTTNAILKYTTDGGHTWKNIPYSVK